MKTAWPGFGCDSHSTEVVERVRSSCKQTYFSEKHTQTCFSEADAQSQNGKRKQCKTSICLHCLRKDQFKQTLKITRKAGSGRRRVYATPVTPLVRGTQQFSGSRALFAHATKKYWHWCKLVNVHANSFVTPQQCEPGRCPDQAQRLCISEKKMLIEKK